MIFGYFNRKRKNRTIVDELYRQLTEMARDPVYYAKLNVPDSVMGRFEMLSVVMVLFFRAARAAGPSVEALSQDIVDTFFLDIDHSIRELGVGDVSVPRRMKKLARMFYGRAQTYGEALDQNDVGGLAEALARNIYPSDNLKDSAGQSTVPDMTKLAVAIFDLDRRFEHLSAASLLAGRLQPVADCGSEARSAG